MRKIKPKTDKMMTDSPANVKEKPNYPTIRIDLDHIPEAKKWKIGNHYKITMDVKMVGISQSKYQNDSEFEIREIETAKSESTKEVAIEEKK